MKNFTATVMALAAATMLGACSQDKPSVEIPRPVRTTELRYDAARESNRYVGTVHSRYEVEQAFRVGGKVARRLVDVGQVVREGDVLAVLDATDYRLGEEAAQQAWTAAVKQARQAESDRQRLNALKTDGSVSDADDERARTAADTARAAAEAEARKLELARNRLKYTELRASRSGVVTAVRFEVGQVVPEGVPVLAIADPGSPEIVVDVPEDQLAAFRKQRFKATLASAPGASFDVALRELSPQAAAQTRTFRARLRPAAAKVLPLGATATVLTERTAADAPVAALPATALTQSSGKPAVWAVKAADQASTGTVELVPVQLHGYRNDEVLVSGAPAGLKVVTAGVHKMAPGLKVALPAAAVTLAEVDNTPQQAAR